MNTISCCIAHTHLAQLRECPTTSGPRVRHSLVISFLQSRRHLKDVVAGYLFGSHRCIKEIHAFSMISLHVHECQWARGGGNAQESYCWEGSTPRTNRLPFYISFWIEKIPISYTFN